MRCGITFDLVKHFLPDQLELCVDSKLQPFRKAADSYDVVITKGTPRDKAKNYSPFVGEHFTTTAYLLSKNYVHLSG